MRSTTLSIALITLMAASSIDAQTIYEWRDENGTVSYSDTPPEGVEAESTGQTLQRTDDNAVRADLAAKQKASEEQAVVDAENQQVADAEAQVAQQLATQKAANCEIAKRKLQSYNSNRRIYKTDENGEITEWLDIDEERAKAQNEVSQYCN